MKAGKLHKRYQSATFLSVLFFVPLFFIGPECFSQSARQMERHRKKALKIVEELAVECSSGNEKSCVELKQRALYGMDTSRIVAIRKMPYDPVFLSKIYLDDIDPSLYWDKVPYFMNKRTNHKPVIPNSIRT